MAQIKHTYVLQRAGEDDRLYGWLTRTADTDGFYQWNGSGWSLLMELDGTDLIYSATSLQGLLYFADGKHRIIKYDPDNNEICEPDATAPVVQYLITYQERIIGAGDARTQAEVIADGGVWPADSNRNRVIFSETLDDVTWPPNNFIDCDTGTGEVVSGLGVNSINSATKGAQTQLVVFKPHSTFINDGVLASADQKLNIVSNVHGCPGYHSIVNTPFGLVFTSAYTVCMLDTTGKEPSQVGFLIHPAILEIPEDRAKWSAAIFHDNTYKLSITPTGQTTNQNEWWLDLRPQIFPNEQNWYGPHTGDRIFQYQVFQGLLIGAQDTTTTMWQLDVEGQYDSMTSSGAPRNSIMIWPRFKVDNLAKGKLDAYGFRGITDTATTVPFIETVDYDDGDDTDAKTLTVPVKASIYNVTRPLRRTSYTAQITIEHEEDSDIEINTLYLRHRSVRRQSEKGTGTTQVTN